MINNQQETNTQEATKKVPDGAKLLETLIILYADQYGVNIKCDIVSADDESVVLRRVDTSRKKAFLSSIKDDSYRKEHIPKR